MIHGNNDAPQAVLLSPATPKRAKRSHVASFQKTLCVLAVLLCACSFVYLGYCAKHFAEQRHTSAFQRGVVWVGAAIWTPLALLSLVSTAQTVRAAFRCASTVRPRFYVEYALYGWGIATGFAFGMGPAEVHAPQETSIMVVATCVLCVCAVASVLAYRCAVPADLRLPHIV